MGQTLTHGVYLPDEGERNCYSGLAANWQILDGAVGTIAAHTAALSGKAPLVHTHTKSDITDFPAYGNAAGTICEGNDSRLSDARTPVAHTHLTADVTDLLNTSHEWTKEQICDEGFTVKSTTIERCVTPETVKHINFIFKDKNNKGFGSIRRYFRNNGEQQIEIFGNTRIKDGQYDETGSDVFFGFSISIKPDGTRYFSFDGYLNNSIRPRLTDTFQLGDSSYQWNKVYSKEYYYNGTAWGLDKANTWTGTNTFTSSMYCNDAAFVYNAPTIEQGTAPASTKYYGARRVYDKNSNQVFQERGYIGTTKDNCYRWVLTTWDSGSYKGFEIITSSDGTNVRFTPYSNGDTDLGTSDKKWKTFNGINPGALSLPQKGSGATILDVTAQGLNWDLTGATDITYTPTFDGWLQLRCKDTDGDFLFATWGQIRQSVFGRGFLAVLNEGLALTIPVRKDITVNMRCKATANMVAAVTPCLGNV